MLHQILNSNPHVALRDSTMILQNILNNNTREVAELSEN